MNLTTVYSITLDHELDVKGFMNSVGYGAGRGGFSPLRPRRDMGRGGILYGNRPPLPSGASPRSVPGRAPFLTTEINRGPPRE